MAFPRKLKQMMMFIDGVGYAAEAESVTLPDLARKFETYRGGSMHRAVKIDMGSADDLNLEHKYGGPIRDILAQYGLKTLTGAQLRFVGNYQDDSTGAVSTCEIVVRGRHETITRGEQKPGEAGEFGVTTACTYYKESWDGVVVIEDDALNGILIVDGEDLMAEHRRRFGLGF